MKVRRESNGTGGIALFIFAFACLFFAGDCFGQAEATIAEQLDIGSIETEGNVTLAKARILATIRSRPGNMFDPTLVQEDIRRIAKLPGVVSVSYDTKVVNGLVKLTFVIDEKNLVRAIIFRGNNKFRDGRLTDELGFKRGDYLDIFLARNAIEALTKLYHKKGYESVVITLDESQLELGRVVYDIQEGASVRVKKVVFQGNEAIKSKELKKVIKTRTRKAVFWPVYYNSDEVYNDVTKLRQVYHKKGFLNVRVDKLVEFNDDRTKAYVTFVIDEGPVYIIDKIIITGGEAELLEELKLQQGDYYSQEKGDYDEKHILAYYRQRGFIDVTVKHKFMLPEAVAEARVTVEFEVVPGERFRIGTINITGNESVHDKVIRRVLDEDDFMPGQWYNADIARGDGQGLLEKDVKMDVMAESVAIQPVGTRGDSRDVRVSTVEGKTGDIMVGAGLSSDSGVMGQFVFNQRNFDIKDRPKSWKDFFRGKGFKGAGQQLRIAAEPGTELSRYSVSFLEPYLYDKPVSLNLTGSSFERGRESYNEQRMKGYVGFEKRYPDKWRRGISFRGENVEVTDLEADAPKEIRDVKGNNDLAGARLFIRKDTTDSKFTPSKGYNFDAGYEQVAGDHTFGIINGTQRWYKTLHEDLAERKTVLETKLYAATVVGDAPPFEKFYAGGTGSLRGFDYRGVSTRGLQFGPTVTNPKRKDPIGSDWIIVANAEVAVPITTEVLSALFFVDAGAIDSGGIRASIGTGLQIMLPQWFGPVPMRFELAVPFMKDEGDETRAFSFSVGALF